MIKERARKEVRPYTLMPGDTFELKFRPAFGDEVILLEEPIEEKRTINEVAVFEVEDEFGFKNGLFGIFGEA